MLPRQRRRDRPSKNRLLLWQSPPSRHRPEVLRLRRHRQSRRHPRSSQRPRPLPSRRRAPRKRRCPSLNPRFRRCSPNPNRPSRPLRWLPRPRRLPTWLRLRRRRQRRQRPRSNPRPKVLFLLTRERSAGRRNPRDQRLLPRSRRRIIGTSRSSAAVEGPAPITSQQRARGSHKNRRSPRCPQARLLLQPPPTRRRFWCCAVRATRPPVPHRPRRP